ncbi:hypothetical protein OAE42_04950 [Gammaproteobacteria bacterium]|nr:hypothetical protein [Gammaproteobacteria bacterium]
MFNHIASFPWVDVVNSIGNASVLLWISGAAILINIDKSNS